jgi:hypothetical protein
MTLRLTRNEYARRRERFSSDCLAWFHTQTYLALSECNKGQYIEREGYYCLVACDAVYFLDKWHLVQWRRYVKQIRRCHTTQDSLFKWISVAVAH